MGDDFKNGKDSDHITLSIKGCQTDTKLDNNKDIKEVSVEWISKKLW